MPGVIELDPAEPCRTRVVLIRSPRLSISSRRHSLMDMYPNSFSSVIVTSAAPSAFHPDLIAIIAIIADMVELVDCHSLCAGVDRDLVLTLF